MFGCFDVDQGMVVRRIGLMKTETFKVACSNCNLRELCLPVGLSEQDFERVEGLVSQRRRVERGQALFRDGEKFEALYAIRSGFFKTNLITEDGREQITGFQMAGEIMGLDGIVNDHFTCNAVALENSEVCLLPYDRVEMLAREVPSLQKHIHKIMSREIVRENSVMLLLGSMHANERLAAFLLNLIGRLKVRGYSQTEMVLRMTREEIGNYLGLKIETISRTFSKFVEDGILEVQQRAIKILRPEALRLIANPEVCSVQQRAG